MYLSRFWGIMLVGVAYVLGTQAAGLTNELGCNSELFSGAPMLALGTAGSWRTLIISSANPLHLHKLREDYGLVCLMLYDEERLFGSALQIYTYPFNLVVNRDQVILEIHGSVLLPDDYERLFSLTSHPEHACSEYIEGSKGDLVTPFLVIPAQAGIHVRRALLEASIFSGSGMTDRDILRKDTTPPLLRREWSWTPSIHKRSATPV